MWRVGGVPPPPPPPSPPGDPAGGGARAGRVAGVRDTVRTLARQDADAWRAAAGGRVGFCCRTGS